MSSTPAGNSASSSRNRTPLCTYISMCHMSTARSETPKAVAVYCRISDDKTGAGLGVARQEETCRELAARLGWDVGRVYVDNDISAYRRKRRPQYMEMLGAIKRGEVDGLIAWHNDRLHRNPRELEDFIDLVEAAGIPVQTVSAGEYDLTTASGRMTARIIGAVARGESEHKAERQKAKHDELRAAGAPAGGARPFGLSPILRRPDGSGYREIVPAEAAALRHVAEGIAAGTLSVRGACRWLNARGLRCTLGHEWQPIVLTRALTAEWVVGKRCGKPAQWPAILDDGTQRLVAALLTGRRRDPGHPFGRTLLSGIAVCSLCGKKLVSRPRSTGRPAYVCAKDTTRDDGRCGGIRVLAEPVEEDLLLRLRARLDEGRLAPLDDGDASDAAATTELGRLEDIKRRLAEMAGSGAMDLADYRTASAANDAAIAAVNARLARDARAEAQRRERAEAPALLARWAELDTDARRRVVEALCAKVEIMPAVRGRNFYTTDRLVVTPR